MKLNTRRTLCVGFAFFLICVFWQAYDTIIPKILTDKFGMSQAASGVVMALDNILALFLLPLFGALSDRVKTPLGRRTPFILAGTIAACLLLGALTGADGMQLRALGPAGVVDDPAGLETVYDAMSGETLRTHEGEEFVLGDLFTREEFAAIRTVREDGTSDPAYASYVSPARQAYAAAVTREHRAPLIAFMSILLLLLIAMALFRSPAVALMPDVTPKPLRSKGNAIINLMGSAGGILVLALGTVMATGAVRNALMPYRGFFLAVAAIMLVSLAAFLATVRENRFAEEMREISRKAGIDEEEEGASGGGSMPAAQKRSLLFLLSSIVLWFMAYNAVSSKYSVYAGKVLGLDYNLTLIIAQGAAILAYLPVGLLSTRFGRKKMILCGIVMLTAAFGIAAFLRADSPALLMNAMFALAGIGWATINVNSFPMVVEMARAADTGRYTGFYYTASMAAQIVTPMFSGFLMDKCGLRVLFPYATIFAALSFVTMLFVRHGDSKPVARRGLEAFDTDE